MLSPAELVAFPPPAEAQTSHLETPAISNAEPAVVNSSASLASLLRSMLGTREATDSRLARFIAEDDPVRALSIWLNGFQPKSKAELIEILVRAIGEVDRLLNDQLNALLHHPALQKLEASWRGLRYLVDKMDAEGNTNIKIRMLNVSWKEIERDFERAAEFDQSQLFHKVYSAEFGMPGGIPFSVMLADYQMHPRPKSTHPHDDISVLRSLSQVAAAAFTPTILSAHPSLFELDDFSELEHQLDHSRTFEHLDYLKWRAFRDTEDSRFMAMVMPQVLMRLPYEDDGTRIDRFQFREDVSGADKRKYLWGNAVYAFGGVLIRAFAQSGWLADIRATQRGIDGGGLVTGLPSHSFSTDKTGLVPKSSTEVVITDELERYLANLGFIPLCRCKDTEYSAFYSNSSLQKPKQYDRSAASANAKISSMLMYMLCVSRFAHYIKVIGRDKVGMFTDPGELQSFLQNWIMRYVTADAEAPPATKAKFPLREAQIEVVEQPGKPGAFQCVMHLAPHYQLDELSAKVRVVTELAPPRVS